MTDNRITKFLNSPEWQQLQENQLAWGEKFKKEADDLWDSLDYEQQLRVFYSVCRRIYQGDVVDKGTYRYVLYDIFRFEPDAYVIGMDSGYMAIHNAIVDIDEFEELKKENDELKKQLSMFEDDLK